MKLRRILAGTATAMLIGAGSVVATVAPAQAADDGSLKVCNSVNSMGDIKVYRVGHPFDPPMYYLSAGGSEACVTMTGATTVRVDVNPEEAGWPDVDSYYIGVEGQGYGPCHDSENDASDPPNTWPKYVKYNTNAGHC